MASGLKSIVTLGLMVAIVNGATPLYLWSQTTVDSLTPKQETSVSTECSSIVTDVF